MAEIDKFEAMEVRTRKQEEELARMKRNKKRNFIVGFSVLGAAVVGLIAVYCLSAFVWLADLVTLPYIEYSYSAKEGTTTATITRLKAESDYPENFRIPAKVNGLTVTGVGPNAFAGCDRLTKVTMTDNITWVGDYAFAGCTNLESFEFSDNITHLGTGVFNETSYLKHLPKNGVSVVSQILFNVGDGIIKDNTVLLADHDSVIPDEYKSSEYNIVYISDWSEEVAISGWGEALFQGKQGIVYAEVPSYLEALPTNTFNGCKNLKEIKFSDEVTSIADLAFANTTNLDKIHISDNVTTIGKGAFKGSGISEINLPSNLTKLGDGVFENCKNLTTFDWDTNVNVAASTFKNCTNLAKLNFSDEAYEGITNIGESAFEGTALVDITIPKNVSTLSTKAFNNANKLETVRLYQGEKGQDAIGYPYAIGLKAVEPKAFRNTALKEVILLNDEKVEVSPKNKITFPNTIESFSTSSSSGEIFSGEIDSDGNYTGPTFEEFIFPAFTRATAYQMFKNQIHLKNVVFNQRHDGASIEGLKKIGYESFYGAISIETLDVPNTVATIEGYAFANMDSLTSIHLPEAGSGLRVINKGMFENSKNLKSVNINEDIFTLKEGAFNNTTSLEYVYIPFAKTATDLSIEKNTFNHCREVGETPLKDEEKMPIFLNVKKEDVNSTYVKEPVVKDGEVISEGFYDPLTCKVYWAGEWHMDSVNNKPVVGAEA